jgi:cbb3-type cytochrome oxidase subunit 3
MFEAITAWATIAIAIGTLLSVYVAYRGIKSQTQSFANSVAANLALKLVHDFDSSENRGRRSRAANALLNHLVYRLRNDYTGSVCFARWILRRMSSPLAFQV